MKKVTAIIPTFNEEAHIAAAIESVQWADEVLVVDSGSTDATVALARQYEVTVLERPFDTHARQKNWAITQARHDWIFILDADERVPPAMQEEIKAVLSEPSEDIGYWVGRDNFFMDRQVRYSGWQFDKLIRLFHRQHCRYDDKQVHEEIIFSGPTGKLRHHLLHYTYRGLAQYLEKWDRYTWLAAKERMGKHKPVTLWHLALKPPVRFLRHYLFYLGFLDGKVGFAISYLSAASVFMRNLKLWRMQEGEEEQ